MRKVMWALVIALGVIVGAGSVEAQIEMPDLTLPDMTLDEGVVNLWDIAQGVGEWVVEHGSPVYFYDLVGDETGGRTLASVRLFDIAEMVDFHLGVGVDSIDSAPMILGGVGIEIGRVLEKIKLDWKLPIEVGVGAWGGYDVGAGDWVLGPGVFGKIPIGGGKLSE